jgi:hypothetical protein
MTKKAEKEKEVSIIMASLEHEQIPPSKAAMIESAFAPMVDMLKAFEKEYNEIVSKEMNEYVCHDARTLRLKMVKVRTGAKEIHKAQKEEVLRVGRAIDGVKNILEFAVTDKEKKLEEIENHYVNLVKAEQEVLRNERAEKLRPYGYDIGNTDLALMDANMFDAILVGAEKTYNDKIIADKKAEEERIALEKENAIAKQKVLDEMEALRVETEKKEKANAIIKAKADKELAIQKAKNDELQAQLKAIAEKEAKEKKDRELAEKKAKKAPDKTKLTCWIDDLDLPIIDLKQPESMMLSVEIATKFNGFKKWAKEQINNL